MKTQRSSYDRRRRTNPLAVLPVAIVLIVLALLFWFWSRGGPQAQAPVEKAIPAERLGR